MLKRALFLLPALIAAVAHADLSIGDKAPELKVANYVKGSQVDLTKGVHVVEFWATWCGPCKMSIPHLTEMAKKYTGKVDFTGVSVWEHGNDQLGLVTKFVNDMGDKMDYNVAWDGDAKYMTTNWMQAAKQNGIPASFLVKDGQVLWIGHPMSGLDTAIDSVLAGTFDITAAKKQQQEQAAEEAKMEEASKKRMALLKPYYDAVQKKDTEAALKALDVATKKDASMASAADMMRFNLLVKSGDKRAYVAGEKLANGAYKGVAMGLNQLAWTVLDPENPVKNPNYKFALKIAEQALKAAGGKDPMIMDTYALALYKNGKKAEAIKVETEAIELLKQNKEQSDQYLKEFEARLASFK